MTPSSRNLITDADRELHAEGKTRNDIARKINHSPSTVTSIARALDCPLTAQPLPPQRTLAKSRNRARWTDIVSWLYGRAARILGQLESDRYTFTATTINGMETKVLDHLPALDDKALATAMATHLGAAARLEQVDTDTTSEGAKSMLDGLAVALGITTGTA